MPTYEYACKACDEHIEVVQSFKDEPLSECPACGGSLRKVFSPIGVVFKGSGFYKTDSRTAPKGAKSPGTDKAASSSESTGPKESAGPKESSGSKESTSQSSGSSDSAGSKTSSSSTPSAAAAS